MQRYLMSLAVVGLVLVLAAVPVAAPAQTGGSDVSELRSGARSVILETRSLLDKGIDTLRAWTKFSDEELFAVGVGALVGYFVADFIGGGGLMTLALIGGGGYLGHWAVTAPD